MHPSLRLRPNGRSALILGEDTELRASTKQAPPWSPEDQRHAGLSLSLPVAETRTPRPME